MLAIKLRRIGKKHQASFRIVVIEKRSKVDGRYTDNIGWLNPNNKEFNIKKEKALHWLKNGAQPTDTVHNLFIKAGVIEGKKISVHKKKKVKEGKAEAEKVNEKVKEAEPKEKKEEKKEEPAEKPKEENGENKSQKVE